MKDPKLTLKEALSRFNYKLVIALAVSVILFLGVFLVVWELGFEIVISIIYGVITLLAAIWYITVNRGFVGKLPDAESLPPTWDKPKREAFVADLRERRRKSKKAMLILIPMIVSFGYKLLQMYLFPTLSNLFS